MVCNIGMLVPSDNEDCSELGQSKYIHMTHTQPKDSATPGRFLPHSDKCVPKTHLQWKKWCFSNNSEWSFRNIFPKIQTIWIHTARHPWLFASRVAQTDFGSQPTPSTTAEAWKIPPVFPSVGCPPPKFLPLKPNSMGMVYHPWKSLRGTTIRPKHLKV